MLTVIPKILTGEQLDQCRQALDRADWGDGRITAGPQSARVKNNLQLPEQAPEIEALRAVILAALEQSPRFISAALPRHVFPPLFNRYDPGMGFGAHIDNAIRQIPGRAARLRTDLSATLFLDDPAAYDGGALEIEESFGVHAVKLGAGDLVLYPASSLHRVQPVTRGIRRAAFFWVQSMVRDDGARSLLFDLDSAIQELGPLADEHPAWIRLTGCYHNLLRRWGEM